MKQIRCFMIGHRDTPAGIYSHLQYEVERHITQFGATEFIVGHYGNFDYLSAKAVRAAKQKYPHVILSLLLPYHPCECSVEDRNNFDTLFYPDGMETVPRRYAIPTANRYAMQHADYLIAFVQHPASNSAKLVRYARSLEKKGLAENHYAYGCRPETYLIPPQKSTAPGLSSHSAREKAPGAVFSLFKQRQPKIYANSYNQKANRYTKSI